LDGLALDEPSPSPEIAPSPRPVPCSISVAQAVAASCEYRANGPGVAALAAYRELDRTGTDAFPTLAIMPFIARRDPARVEIQKPHQATACQALSV
jgi:hypothetical protein